MGTRLSSTPSAGSSGTVTSVGLVTSGLLHTVSGTPITGAGTLSLDLKTQVQNTLLAGPASGADATPTMRALVNADIPTGITGSKVSGALSNATLATSALTSTIAASQIAAVNPSVLTGTGTVPLAALSGITTSQLDAAAGITSAQIAALATSKLTGTIAASQLAVSAPTSGQLGGLVTANLSATAGILGSQLDAAAAIASGQITSLAASKLTGTNGLPDGVLSTNVPLLASANTFTAAQTISATVAGVLAQVNNASTTGAGVLIGSTAIASAGAGKIAPALALTQATPATANYGLLSIGSAAFDGSTTGKFVGSASGTLVALNAVSGYAGNLLDCQIAGVSKLSLLSSGTLTISNFFKGSGVVDGANTGSFLQTSATNMSAQARSASNVPLTCQGAASQTADLQQWQNSAGAVQFGVTNRGSAGSPIWALKVRATANAESAAQAHTIGAATGKAIEVMDDAGASLGWIALYA